MMDTEVRLVAQSALFGRGEAGNAGSAYHHCFPLKVYIGGR